MNERYERNLGAISGEEQARLLTKSAAVAGCGGLGGFAAEFLARAGIGRITLIDGDSFNKTNLNRQLNATESSLGKNKAHETKRRLQDVRSGLTVITFDCFLTEENAHELLSGHDIIIDALDSVGARLLVERAASDLGIPLVHAAVKEWSAQISVVFPGDFTLAMLYAGTDEEETPSVLPFMPAFAASLETAEALKVLLERSGILRNKLLIADLRENTFETLNLRPNESK